MKKSTKITILVGVLFVVGLLAMSYLYNPTPHITTPEKDAQLLANEAMTIRTEHDLRELEKKAYEYEIAYRESYGGAKAMYFKSLVEPVLVAAGERREAIRESEDQLLNEQNKFHARLSDMDEAWRLELGTDEEVYAMLIANEDVVSEYERDIAELQAQKERLGEQAWQGEGGSLDEECLEKIGEVEEEIESLNNSIAEAKHDINIILLAYHLQHGVDFEFENNVPSTEPIVEEPVVAPVMEF